MQDRSPPTRRNSLATHGRTIHRVKRYRFGAHREPLNVRFAPRATELLCRREMSRGDLTSMRCAGALSPALRERSLMPNCCGSLGRGNDLPSHHSLDSRCDVPLAGALACQVALAAPIASVLLPGTTLVAQPLPQSILVLDQYAASFPWVGARNSAFRRVLNAGRVVPISIYEENLDFNRFAGPSYKESLRVHFREKYRDKAVGLIVAFGPSALEYAVDIRGSLWPRAAVVFGEIAETAISRASLPAAVTGTTINITFDEMLVAARALLHVPLDGSAAALERLDACFERNSRESAETNPFVAPSRKP